MASTPELRRGQGSDFVAQAVGGRVIEGKVVKVHQDQKASLENISERVGGYRVLRNVSGLLTFLECGILIENGTIGNYHGSWPEYAIAGAGILGGAGLVDYFNKKMKDCIRKIEQIKKDTLPTITS